MILCKFEKIGKSIALSLFFCLGLFPVGASEFNKASLPDKNNFNTPFQFIQPMDLSRWEFKKGHIQCYLTNTFPPYGKFYFLSETRNDILFNASFQNLKKSQNLATLFQHFPPWKKETHYYVDSVSEDAGVFIFRDNILNALHAMGKGMWLKVRLDDAKNSIQSTANRKQNTFNGGRLISRDYVLPTIQFKAAYDAFMSCRDELPRMTAAQARTITFQYTLGQFTLSPSQRETLADFFTYYQKDRSITHVLIDGHTDSIGSSLTNLSVSKTRAEDIKAKLIALGVDADHIQLRFHGERYPITSNATAKGRDKNRRVTLRVVKSHEKIMAKK